MPFPSKTTAPEYKPVKATRRWLVKNQLQENVEKVLSLPIGPLLAIQYAQAMTGKRYVWDETLGKPVVLKIKRPRLDANMTQVQDEKGQPVWDYEDALLSEAEHNKLVDKITERALPAIKAIEFEKLRKDEKDPGDEEVGTMTTEEIHAKLAALESSSETPDGAAETGTGEA